MVGLRHSPHCFDIISVVSLGSFVIDYCLHISCIAGHHFAEQHVLQITHSSASVSGEQRAGSKHQNARTADRPLY